MLRWRGGPTDRQRERCRFFWDHVELFDAFVDVRVGRVVCSPFGSEPTLVLKALWQEFLQLRYGDTAVDENDCMSYANRYMNTIYCARRKGLNLHDQPRRCTIAVCQYRPCSKEN